MNIRRLIDFLSCMLLLLCICILPIYILITFQTNKNIIEHVNDINNLFLKLEQSHKINAEILFDSLEFRRIEYKCYFSSENEKFNSAFNISMKKYLEYLSNDKTLTTEEQKILFDNITMVEETFKARTKLLHKLAQYDTKRSIYLKTQISEDEKNIIKELEFQHKETCPLCSENKDSRNIFDEQVKELLVPVDPVKKILDNPIPVKNGTK